MSEIQKNGTNGIVANKGSPMRTPKKAPSIVEPSEKAKQVVTVEEVEVSSKLKLCSRLGFCCILDFVWLTLIALSLLEKETNLFSLLFCFDPQFTSVGP